MNLPTPSVNSGVRRMKKIFTLIILVALISLPALVSAKSGAIWTTVNDCGDEQQNVNHFSAGEYVYINGAGFDDGQHLWDITGLPGQASCDSNSQVTYGSFSVDESGEFCFVAYMIEDDDCGEYKVTFGNKHDNYRVLEAEVPEFSTVFAGVALVGAVAGFIVLRKKN